MLDDLDDILHCTTDEVCASIFLWGYGEGTLMMILLDERGMC
jgi:hypothetical protein